MFKRSEKSFSLRIFKYVINLQAMNAKTLATLVALFTLALAPCMRAADALVWDGHRMYSGYSEEFVNSACDFGRIEGRLAVEWLRSHPGVYDREIRRFLYDEQIREMELRAYRHLGGNHKLISVWVHFATKARDQYVLDQ
jgi:hypothetical protein